MNQIQKHLKELEEAKKQVKLLELLIAQNQFSEVQGDVGCAEIDGRNHRMLSSKEVWFYCTRSPENAFAGSCPTPSMPDGNSLKWAKRRSHHHYD